MKNKTQKPKRFFSYKQKLDELERSIVLMVLSNPALEMAILSNYCERMGYVFQGIEESDLMLNKTLGIGMPDAKHLAWRAEDKAEAEKLYKLARQMRAENETHFRVLKDAELVSKSIRKNKKTRDQNVDRMLKDVLNNVSGQGDEPQEETA